jgi:hypothetical protein
MKFIYKREHAKIIRSFGSAVSKIKADSPLQVSMSVNPAKKACSSLCGGTTDFGREEKEKHVHQRQHADRLFVFDNPDAVDFRFKRLKTRDTNTKKQAY